MISETLSLPHLKVPKVIAMIFFSCTEGMVSVIGILFMYSVFF